MGWWRGARECPRGEAKEPKQGGTCTPAPALNVFLLPVETGRALGEAAVRLGRARVLLQACVPPSRFAPALLPRPLLVADVHAS